MNVLMQRVLNFIFQYDEYHSWILNQIEKASDMSQHERQALQNISTKISPKIRELVENRISENLRSLHNETSLRLINLTNTMKKSIDNFCHALLVDRDNLTKQIEDIKKTVEITVENQNQIKKNEQSFSKVCKNLIFYKMLSSFYMNTIMM